MWRVSYLDLSSGRVEQKGGFSSDKEAIEWYIKLEKEQKIVALKLLVWSEYLQSNRVVEEYVK